MVDDQDKKEDSFEFDSLGEAVEYISLDQARLVAAQAARETPGNYGRAYAGVRMVFELVEQEEREDYHVITLSFRPEGSFIGAPGREQFFVGKEGTVADPQMLSSLPEPERRRLFPIISAQASRWQQSLRWRQALSSLTVVC